MLIHNIIHITIILHHVWHHPNFLRRASMYGLWNNKYTYKATYN